MTTTGTDCSFCEPSVRETQEVVRNAAIRIIYPLAPIIPANVMIIPSRHVERIEEVSDVESLGIFAAVRAIKRAFADLHGMTGLNLFANDGRKAGQHVPHIHFHVFGRSDAELISPYRIMNNPTEFPVRSLSPDELSARVNALRNVISL
jgi:diadenosine tetraphosphate (Ap4A) HIT family hydrolase